jgi:hypothetical protein
MLKTIGIMATKKKELPKNVINPFSDTFLETWDIWKAYKMEEFKFKYKGVHSEQAALMQLQTLSGGDEAKAVKIIFQSMASGWKGLFMLNENDNINGKSITETRKDVTGVLSTRDYERRGD